MLVRDIMRDPAVTIPPGTSLAEAYRIMQHYDVRHLPVVQGDMPIGIVTDRDLRYATSVLHPTPFSEEADVSHVMARNIITTTPLDPVEEAARLMRRNKIGCLPVLEGQKLIGIITGTDLLDAIIRLTGLQRPTGRIAVQLPDTPGQLARVAAIIDAQDVNIHSVLTYPNANKQTLVIFRVDTLNTRALADTLRASGLTVQWPPSD